MITCLSCHAVIDETEHTFMCGVPKKPDVVWSYEAPLYHFHIDSERVAPFCSPGCGISWIARSGGRPSTPTAAEFRTRRG